MGRTEIAKSSMFLLRSWKQIEGRAGISSKAATIVDYSQSIWDHRDFNYSGEEEKISVSWVPHPRTGIFFPPGQDAVMEDVPDGAASLEMKFWLRDVDGVDKPVADPNFYHLPY